MTARLLSTLSLACVTLGAGCAREEDTARRLEVGDLLEDLPLEGADGGRLRTSELRSRVLLIHFFEADSEDCRDQVREIRSLWFPLRRAGLQVLGICPEVDGAAALRTVEAWSLPYPVFLDPDRALTRRFAGRQIPWNVVVGRDGRIVLKEKGRWDRVQAAVEEAVRARVAGPDHVRVQHCLIAFEGSVPGRRIERSREDAARLAAEVLERAKAGEDFLELVSRYSSDATPGVFRLANFNVAVDDDVEEAERGTLVPSFGDVAFSLEIGGVGMAEYHSFLSRYGWHVIKRLE